MHLVERPPGWPVAGVVGGASALGLSGLSFIVDLLKNNPDRLRYVEER
jgi:hypothetical protein